MRYIIEKSKVSGTVNAPPSKSLTHRAIFCASLAEGKSTILNYLDCDDTQATIDACRSLGAKIKDKNGVLEITGTNGAITDLTINCRESGTTIRFLIPMVSVFGQDIELTGSKRLLERPMGPIISAMAKLGVRCKQEGDKITVSGKLSGGKTSIVGNVSSQFISGLLVACPLAEEDTTIEVTTELESKPYVEMTIGVLRDFGTRNLQSKFVSRTLKLQKEFQGTTIKIDVSDDFRTFCISGGQKYKPAEYAVEGDFSSAAFLLAAGAIAGDVDVKNLNPHSVQGDRKIVDVLKRMGADITETPDSVRAKKSDLSGAEIDVRDIPDLVPIIATLGCFAEGETRIKNAGRLRGKESDRLSAISSELKKMGANIVEKEDELIIEGGGLQSARINPYNDHRIAMACAVAALSSGGIIEGAECVAKSYPDFFGDLKRIGAKVVLE
ncbi:MAG: hypothetical protein MSIBF_00330 [Candidatus Altiarchaeales archaeon IMC4]|nr:MAG: hypothetical protein MSIBF_00330 [Candidatus Altiarchaeales archaeon IMC4]